MSNKKIHRKKKKKHNASNYMPPIQPDPTLNRDNIDKLPKIKVNCETDISIKDLNEVKIRLNFADHNDFRRLHCIRIVNPGTIKLPSKGTTSGCYYPEGRRKKAEIWISCELIKRRKGIEHIFNKITYKDRLFETLFHELGHHKARLTHSVDRFEDEAYAEKYMLAYKKCWKSQHGPSIVYVSLFRFVIKLLRVISLAILYPFRNRNKELNLFYRNFKGEITLKEFNELMGFNNTESGKKKWVHPLNKKKYRDRFNLPDR